jgi:multidrug efflux pump subunit AcrA (membrane-fusion protein)
MSDHAASAERQESVRGERSTHMGQQQRLGIFYSLIAFVVIGGLLLAGWLPRRKRTEEVNARANEQKSALPVVQVMTVHKTSGVEQLTLPGTVTPVTVAHIYARAAGYLKKRDVDLGDKVRKGQLLALISAPDLDAIVLQNESLLRENKDALSKAESQLQLQQVTYDRVHTLVQHGVLSQQDDDASLAALRTAAADVRYAQNSIKTAEATLAHAAVLASFEQVTSPIDGIITGRNVDTGSLVSPAGQAQAPSPTSIAMGSGGPPTGGAQGGELFEVADLSALHLFVAVPEQDAPYVQTGRNAELSFSEFPGERFTGMITRSNESLSQDTRSLVLEVKVNDPQHRVRPGMFASVQLRFQAPQPGILISGDSVITQARGAVVPIVRNGVIHMQPVVLGRDLGTQIYVTSGLQNGDTVVVSPNDQVKEGVRVTTQPAPAGQQQ